MNNKTNLLIIKLVSLCEFTLLTVYSSHSAYIKGLASLFKDRILSLHSTRGIDFTIKYIKTSRNCYLRVVSGSPLETSEVALVRGLPKWMLEVGEESIGDPDKIKIILTFLTSLRSIQTKPILATKTITDPWSGVDNIGYLEFCRAMNEVGVTSTPSFYIRRSLWRDFHMSTKKGPHGQALLMAISELTLLPHKLIENIRLLGGPRLSLVIDNLHDSVDVLGMSVSSLWSSLYPLKPHKAIRKLSYFSDKEGKTRVIGIVDYWTQSALRGYHRVLNELLSKLPTDMTFNQSGFLDFLSNRDPGNRFHSIDLSAATDRMPIVLQKRVMAYIFGQERAEAWADLLVGYPFHCYDMGTKKYSLISYQTGQPMGAYSSWPCMALTHHLLVKISALRAGISNFNNYFLLGDDLVIMDDKVALNYKELLSTLDMPYSPDKTHTSFEVFEFAKRWFYKGKEISGFSVGGLLSVYKRYPLLHNFLENQGNHGWSIPYPMLPDYIRGIFKILRPYYIINKINSHIKLYLLFNELMVFKKNPLDELAIGRFMDMIPQQAIIENFVSNYSSKAEAFHNAVYQAKFLLVESDLYKFQSEAYIVNSTLWGIANDFIKGLGSQPKHRLDFLNEVVSVVINWDSPLVTTLNVLVDKSIDFLCNTALSSKELLLPSFLMESGLSKYKFAKGIFSLRNSSSIILAESAVLKKILDVLQKGVKPESELGLVRVSFGPDGWRQSDEPLESSILPVDKYMKSIHKWYILNQDFCYLLIGLPIGLSAASVPSGLLLVCSFIPILFTLWVYSLFKIDFHLRRWILRESGSIFIACLLTILLLLYLRGYVDSIDSFYIYSSDTLPAKEDNSMHQFVSDNSERPDAPISLGIIVFASFVGGATTYVLINYLLISLS